MNMKEGITMKNVHTVNISVDGKDWTDAIDQAFKKKNATATIDGFRKGKAPKDVFIKHYGKEALYVEAIDIALPKAYKKALDDNKLVPACEPKVEVKAMDDEHIEFEFVIITKPEIKLAKYKGLKVKKETPKVTKEEIAHELSHMQSHMADIVVKKTGKVEEGDVAVIDFEGFVDGVAFEGGKGEDYSLEIGSHTFIPGFEEGVVGMKKGDTKDINVKFPEDYVENLKGKDAVFKVTVKEIKTRVLPEMNEEFFKDLGYDDVKTQAELETKIESHLLEHKKEEIENKYIDALIDAGIKEMTVEINDEIIDEEVSRMMEDLNRRLELQGITLENYLQFTNMTMDKFKENARPEATKRIESRYLLDEIVAKEKLEATDEEVQAHAKKQAEKYGVDEKEIIEMYGGQEVVKYDLLIHKAIEILES